MPADRLSALTARHQPELFLELHQELSFDEYLERAYANPRLVRTSYQRLYDMILSFGSEEFERDRKKITRYPFSPPGRSASTAWRRRWTSWSSVSRGRPAASAPTAGSCCCTGRSAVPRVPSAGVSSGAWRTTARRRRGRGTRSAGSTCRRVPTAFTRRTGTTARCTRSR